MKSAHPIQDWAVKAKEIIDTCVKFTLSLWDLIIYFFQSLGSLIIAVLIRVLSTLSPTTIVCASLAACLIVFGVTAVEWWKMGWSLSVLTSTPSSGRWAWAATFLVAGFGLNLMQLASTVEELFTNAAFGVDGPLGDMLHSAASKMNSLDDATKHINQKLLFCIELVWLCFYLIVSGAFVKAFGLGIIAGIGLVAWVGFMVRAQDIVFKVSANIIKMLCK